MQSLQGHSTPVESVTFDHNEEVVAAGAASGSIKLFDLDQAKGETTGELQAGAGRLAVCGASNPSVRTFALGRLRFLTGYRVLLHQVLLHVPLCSDASHVGPPVQRAQPGAVAVWAAVGVHGHQCQGVGTPAAGLRTPVTQCSLPWCRGPFASHV